MDKEFFARVQILTLIWQKYLFGRAFTCRDNNFDTLCIKIIIPTFLRFRAFEGLPCILRPSGAGVRRQGDLRFMLCEASINQQSLTQFMDRLVRTSLRKVFLILDNLKVHHGKKAAA